MTRMDAIALATADALADVRTFTREYGLLPLLLTLEPGSVTWEESARDVGQAELALVPEQHREAYYEQYGTIAEARVRAIRDQPGAPL